MNKEVMSSAIYFLKHIAIKTLGSEIFLRNKLKRIATSGALTILNFHRVDDNEGSAYQAMKPEIFETLIAWLKLRFDIVTFADLKQLSSDGKPPLILSFDDGYKDFIDIVMPILDQHGVRANQNVIPACIDTGRPPMNVILQDFIGSAPEVLLKEISFPGLTEKFKNGNRIRFGNMASAALKKCPIAEQKVIFADLEQHFTKFDGLRTTPVMTLEEVKQAACEHEIGTHSYEHANMNAETDEYFYDDLTRCQNFLSSLGSTSSIYAFPNGAAREEQVQMANKMGFHYVLLVGERFSRPDTWSHNRFTMYAQTFAEAKFRVHGGLVHPTRS